MKSGKVIQLILGIALVLVGAVGGLYLGVWWAFVGGIVDIINQIRAEVLEPLIIALGIAKMLFAGVIGWGFFAICLIPGFIAIGTAIEDI